MADFDESIFIHRLTFLVLTFFISGYFSKKIGKENWQKFLEGIGLHLNGNFFFIACIF